MSRCFPYPPPGYEINRSYDKALIESLKLEREAGKARKEEKKWRKQEKKERKKAQENLGGENKRHGHKRKHKDERSQDKKGDHEKKKKTDAEHLEKSSVTEEHGHPVGSEDSSHSTLNSTKRQKQSTSPDDKHNAAGSIFRICLPFQKQKDPEVLPSKEHPGSADSARNSLFPCMNQPAPKRGRDQGERPCSASINAGKGLNIKQIEEQPCTSYAASKFLALPSQRRNSKSTSLSSQFADLFENWVPPPMSCEFCDSDDQGWLFETKQSHGFEGCKFNSGGWREGKLNCWPQAQLLPDADINALPFTVPF